MASTTVPTPSPLPSPTDTPSHSLSDRINIATRSAHSKLNKLILARLPLALPPYSTNPSIYISGLLHVAPIYRTFESAWQTTLDTPPSPSTRRHNAELFDTPTLDPTLATNSLAPNVSSRTHSLLAHLLLPKLLRAHRLKADICSLSGVSEDAVEHQLRDMAKKGMLARFTAHIKKAVKANPHVLLAYAWVLYMALFSGGRYLRASLQTAGGLGDEFWARDPSPIRPYLITLQKTGRLRRRGSSSSPSSLSLESSPHGHEERGRKHSTRSEEEQTRIFPGLQFFHFVGEEDGEDIKRDFKKRIADAESLLSDVEKEDIILEAQAIFNFMLELVDELDGVMDTNEDDVATEKLHQSFRNKVSGSRDSLTVAQDRLSKKDLSDSDILDTPPELRHFVIPDPLSQLKDALLPSLYTVTKSRGRKVSFRKSLGGDEQDEGASQLLFPYIHTALGAFFGGVALLLAWWVVVYRGFM